MTRERVVWVLALLAMVLGAWWLSANTEWVEEEHLRPAQGEARDNPVYALEQLLKKLGVAVAHHGALDALPPRGGRLVMLSADWELKPERAEQMHQWVLRGGHLVLVQNTGWDAKALAKWMPITEQEVMTADRPRPAPRPAPVASAVLAGVAENRVTLVSTPPLWDGTEMFGTCAGLYSGWKLRAKPGHTAAWALARVDGTPSTQTVLALQTRALQAMQGLPTEPVKRADAPVQALRVNLGQGSVTVLNTGDGVFRNFVALRCDNPLLLAAAVQAEPGATVWIYLDEKREPLLRWLWRSGWIAVVAGALALAAALWRAAVRFGPRLAPAPRLRRSISEQVRGLAAYLQGGGREALLVAQQRALAEVAARTLPRYARLSPRERMRAVAQATGIAADELAAAMTAKFCTRAELLKHLPLLEAARRRLDVQPLVQPRTAERGASGRSPEGTAMPAGSTGKHSPERAGSGAAQRSARNN